MEDQLNRIEKKLDEVHAIVHQHVGFISAMRWILGGIGAAFVTALSYLGITRG